MAMEITLHDDEPICTFEEFVRYQGLVDWPVTFEEHLEISSHFDNFRKPSQIFDFFKFVVPFPIDIIASITKNYDELWSKVNLHKSVMSEAQRQKPEQGLDGSDFTPFVEKAHRKMKERTETVSRSLYIEDYEFPGFSRIEDTEVPGHPDALQLLDCISVAQSFNRGFLKIWKPFFVSALSVAVFKDAFWWFFLHNFKPNLEDEDKLLDHIAGEFVSLLMTVQMDLKDKLFKVYADCLAQAVYSAFYGAFPGSLDRLDDNFKRDLADLISLWVSGVKPNLFSWKNWNLSWLLQSGDASGEKVTESVCDLQVEFDELVSNAKRLNSAQPSLSVRGSIGTAEAKMADSSRCRESHYFGPGPEFQHVRFKPCGQSPLVARYLQLNGIPSPAGSDTRRIKRTEIVKLPTHSKPTYQDVMGEFEELRNKRRQEYSQFCQQTKQDIAEIQQEIIFNNREFNRLRKEICSNPNEIQILSEGILNKWDFSTFHRQRLQTKKEELESESEQARNAEECAGTGETAGTL